MLAALATATEVDALALFRQELLKLIPEEQKKEILTPFAADQLAYINSKPERIQYNVSSDSPIDKELVLRMAYSLSQLSPEGTEEAKSARAMFVWDLLFFNKQRQNLAILKTLIQTCPHLIVSRTKQDRDEDLAAYLVRILSQRTKDSWLRVGEMICLDPTLVADLKGLLAGTGSDVTQIKEAF